MSLALKLPECLMKYIPAVGSRNAAYAFALLVQLGSTRLRKRVATCRVPGKSGEHQLQEADADAEEPLPHGFQPLRRFAALQAAAAVVYRRGSGIHRRRRACNSLRQRSVYIPSNRTCQVFPPSADSSQSWRNRWLHERSGLCRPPFPPCRSPPNHRAKSRTACAPRNCRSPGSMPDSSKTAPGRRWPPPSAEPPPDMTRPALRQNSARISSCP